MFEDGDWVGNTAKKRAYKRWWLAQKKRLRADKKLKFVIVEICLLYTSPSPRDRG